MPSELSSSQFILETAIAVLLVPLAIVMWFLVRKLISDMAKVEKALADHQLHVATFYVQKEDFHRNVDALFDKLQNIENFIRTLNHPS